ncbi:MAG: glycerophosphodiester phosphodiesterase [Myxococcota bacterium]
MRWLERALRLRWLDVSARSPSRPQPDAALQAIYPGRPLLLAHRGDRAHFPENTVLAVTQALARGADGSEFDVRLSRDGVPVVIHDDTVDRTMHATGPVSSFSSVALGAMRARRHSRWGTGPEPGVPTLAELLAAMPDGAVAVVELKGPVGSERQLEARALEVMEPHRRRLHMMVSSFHPGQLLNVRERDGDIALGVLAEPEQLLPLRLCLQALPLRAAALHLPVSMVDAELVARAHRAGRRVHVWRVLNRTNLITVLDAGADAVMVDDVPAAVVEMQRWLERRGLPSISSP